MKELPLSWQGHKSCGAKITSFAFLVKKEQEMRQTTVLPERDPVLHCQSAY